MGRHRETGERFVAEANPRFKDFRVDFEKISTAASRTAREGREGLTFDDASAMFHDVDWDLRIPLQTRYAEQGAFDPLAHYHAKRFKLLLGRNEPWPDEPGQHALGLFADFGRADVGVALIRTYVEMQHKRLKQDYSARNPRKSRVQRSEGVERAIASVGKAIANAIPDRKAELLKDIESVEPYMAEHGTDEDTAWLEAVRRELWMEKRA
jgi:hypothetical protein